MAKLKAAPRVTMAATPPKGKLSPATAAKIRRKANAILGQ